MKTKNNKSCVQVQTSIDYPEEYLHHRLQAVRYELGRRLAQELYYDRWYAIKFHENWPHPWESSEYNYDRTKTYMTTVEIQAIETVPIYMPEPIDYSGMTRMPLINTALKEIKYRVKNRLKNLKKLVRGSINRVNSP